LPDALTLGRAYSGGAAFPAGLQSQEPCHRDCSVMYPVS